MTTDFRKYDNVWIGEGSTIGDYVILGLPPAGKEEAELDTKIGSNAIIRSHTVIYSGNEIGSSFQTGHNVMIRENNRIGNNVSIGTGSIIEHHLVIEDGVRIHSQAFIPEYSVLKEGCWIGPNVVLTNALHPLCPKVKECLKGPTIGRNSKIGANVTILPDLTIGENALVGSGSVVTKDVPDGMVVAGNPAKVIKRVDELTCPYNFIERPYEI